MEDGKNNLDLDQTTPTKQSGKGLQCLIVLQNSFNNQHQLRNYNSNHLYLRCPNVSGNKSNCN